MIARNMHATISFIIIPQSCIGYQLVEALNTLPACLLLEVKNDGIWEKNRLYPVPIIRVFAFIFTTGYEIRENDLSLYTRIKFGHRSPYPNDVSLHIHLQNYYFAIIIYGHTIIHP